MTSHIWKIENDRLTVLVQELGAQLWSIKDKEGNEYLWQGDEKYWGDRAPNLFPHIARLTEGSYTLNGQRYQMDIHGFAKDSIFVAEKVSDSHIIFTIKDSEATREQYPFTFTFSISYRLVDNGIEITYSVKNEDNKEMYFGVGAHPGFCVPFEEGTVFEDYYLEFDQAEEAKRVGFSEDCYVTGPNVLYPQAEEKKIPLRHDMFDDDAIVLVDMARGVTLTSDKGKKAIYVSYPDMPYLGLWHWPKTDAPYICIEPWSSLPARKDVVEDFATQPSMLSLKPGSEYENRICIQVIEK